MHLFLAADTYLHQPRNIFGFKKRGVDPEPRLVTTALADSDGCLIHTGRYRARLEDDLLYTEEIKSTLKMYGRPARTGYNLDDLNMEINSNSVLTVLVLGADVYGVLDKAYEKVYGDSMTTVVPNVDIRNFDEYLVSRLYQMRHSDLALLSGADYFTSTIPLSDGRYSLEEVRELWESCAMRLNPYESRNSAIKVGKMKVNYDLVTRDIPYKAGSLRLRK